MNKFFTVFLVLLGIVVLKVEVASANVTVSQGVVIQQEKNVESELSSVQSSELELVSTIIDSSAKGNIPVTEVPIPYVAKDIKHTYWAYGVISDLVSQGIVSIENERFNPNKGVSVGTFSSWLTKAGVKYKPVSSQKSSDIIKKDTVRSMLGYTKKDLSASYFYGINVEENIHQVYLMGALQYDVNVVYSGSDTVTRAEAALIVKAMQTAK